jgi:hypothetical protein
MVVVEKREMKSTNCPVVRAKVLEELGTEESDERGQNVK